jgi:hypothetical protein
VAARPVTKTDACDWVVSVVFDKRWSHTEFTASYNRRQPSKTILSRVKKAGQLLADAITVAE